jgi:predicted GNAT family acetyltransferase
MKVNVYTGANEFLARTHIELEKNEAANNLLLGLADRLVTEPNFYGDEPFFATVESEEDNALLIAVLRTPPHSLIVHAAVLPMESAMAALAEEIVRRDMRLPGVMGPAEAADAFARVFAVKAGYHARLAMRERVYELRHVVTPRPVAGRLRKAGDSDPALLLRWYRDFTIEALPDEDPDSISDAEALRHLLGMYVWEDNGCPVSMARIARHTPHGATVGPVYTPPELRGRGYASNCVAAISQIVLDSGRDFCALLTNLENPTSNHIYMAIGYQPFGDFHQYRFEPFAG